MDMHPPLKYPFFAACQMSAVRPALASIFSNAALLFETVTRLF
jgi:hypothetical protein